MRNTLLALLAAICVSASSGCCGYHWWGHHGGCDSCKSGCDQGCGYCGANCGACGPGGCQGGDCQGGCGGGEGCGGGCAACGAACGCLSHNSDCSPIPDCADNRAMVGQQLGGPAGPPAAQVTYPYYTVRGPRDFFAKNPPSIGP